MENPERALFRAVIARAIMDAKGASVSGKPTLEALAKQQAKSWLSTGGNDFRTVCALAEIDASAVREAFISGKLERVHLDTGGMVNPIRQSGEDK